MHVEKAKTILLYVTMCATIAPAGSSHSNPVYQRRTAQLQMLSVYCCIFREASSYRGIKNSENHLTPKSQLRM